MDRRGYVVAGALAPQGGNFRLQVERHHFVVAFIQSLASDVPFKFPNLYGWIEPPFISRKNIKHHQRFQLHGGLTYFQTSSRSICFSEFYKEQVADGRTIGKWYDGEERHLQVLFEDSRIKGSVVAAAIMTLVSHDDLEWEA